MDVIDWVEKPLPAQMNGTAFSYTDFKVTHGFLITVHLYRQSVRANAKGVRPMNIRTSDSKNYDMLTVIQSHRQYISSDIKQFCKPGHMNCKKVYASNFKM